MMVADLLSLKVKRARFDSMKFPLCKLPLVAQEALVQQMTPIDIIHLSILSKNMHRLTRSSRAEFSDVRCQISKDNFEFEFRSSIRPYNPVEFEIYVQLKSDDAWYTRDRFPPKTVILNNQEVEADSFEKAIFFTVPRSSAKKNLQACLALFNYVIDLLSIKNLVIKAEGIPLDIIEAYDSQVDRYYKSLEICQEDVTMNLHQFWMRSKDFEKFRKILETTKARSLFLRWAVHWDIKYHGVLRIPNLNLYHATWLTIDSILNMECESLELNESKLTSEEINQLVKQWMEGGFENLKYISVHIKEDVEEHVLFNEVKTKVLGAIACKNQWGETIDHKRRELVRRCDGKKAIVDMVENRVTFSVLN